MKQLLKAIGASILAVCARLVIRRYKPKIVMVTGSVGKTSTKDAVAAVLAARFFVRKSEKSFNSEFGVPFTILGVGNPWGKPTAWLAVLKSAFTLLVLPNHYPALLVLEVGADRPGDLERILRIATPDAVVLTRLPEIPVHVEAYASPDAVREEESLPAYALSSGGPLIVNADDEYALEVAARTSARVITYGVSDESRVRVSATDFYIEEGVVVGMQTKVQVGEEDAIVTVRGSVGKAQVLPAAAAIAIATTFDIALPEALEALAAYEPPPGRGRLFRGKRGSVIVDDSYNASPAAVEEALTTLKAFPGARRRIAVLGDMLELGRYSVMEHERLGALAAESCDVVVSVGIRARGLAAAAIKAGAQTETFDESNRAGLALADIVQEGDVVLVKGSQGVRMERVVEQLLADSADRARLVRQEKEWRKRR